MIKLKAAAAALGLSAVMFTSGAVYTSSAHAQVVSPTTQVPGARPNWRRGERGSARNLMMVRRHLERAIDELQHDQHDYGGHREQAIDLMQRAREQIEAAIQYDRSHPNQ